VNTAALVSELRDALPGHLVRQRWFGGKGRSAPSVRVTSIEALRSSWPALVRVVVECDDGGRIDRYQLVLGLRPVEDAGPSAPDPLALVGPITIDGKVARCFDALVDPELALLLLRHIAPTQHARHARPIGVEQSNTSLVYDDRIILKLFRRLASPNPEIEMTVGLARQGFAHVAEPLAVWRDGNDDLALLQHFLLGGIDGWTLALASIRDLLGHRSPSEGPGADLAADAASLGVVTAALHLALADAFGTERGAPAAWADAASTRFGSTDHPDIDRSAVHATIDRIRDLDDGGKAIRIHGDYHLGQVLRTGHDWYVLDFEGEPTRPIEERRARSSPLRDVAGMLRSFSYAAAVGRREHDAMTAGRATSDDVSAAVAAWERRSRHAFLAAYLARLEGSVLLPADPSSVDALLDVFELDKAVYEVDYEQGNRPDWVQIPLDGVRALLERGLRRARDAS
jgi:maltokinase